MLKKLGSDITKNSSIAKQILLTTALTTGLLLSSNVALAAECGNTIIDNCEISTTNSQDYTITSDITALGVEESGVFFEEGAIVNSVTVNPGVSVSSTGPAINLGLVYAEVEGNYQTSTIDTITISEGASITASDDFVPGLFISSGSTVTNIHNYGTIDGWEGFSLINLGTVTNLVNAQTNLWLAPLFPNISPNLPTNYYTYFSDVSTFGKVSFFTGDNTNDAFSYGVVAADGVTLEAGTYAAVMTFDEERTEDVTIIPLSGYNLSLQSSDNLVWNLVISAASSDVLSSAQSQLNRAAYGAAAVIDNDSTLSALFSGLGSGAAKSLAATQTLPLMTGGSAVVIGNALSNMNHIIQSRISKISLVSDKRKQGPDRRFWVQPFKTWNKQNNVDNVEGYKSDISGVLVGMDKDVREKLHLGFAVGYARANVNGHLSVSPHGMDVNMHQLIGYGGYKLGKNTELSFQLDGGYNETRGRRVINFRSSSASSKYDSYSGHVGVGLSNRYDINKRLSFISNANVDYTRIKDKGYRESGASNSLNLKVDDNSRGELLTTVNGRLNYEINPKSMLHGKLGGGYDHINKRAKVTAAYESNLNNKFSTAGFKRKPWVGRAGAGLSYAPNHVVDLVASYDAELRKKYHSQTLSAVVRIKF